ELFHLGHHFGADAVAGKEQKVVGCHRGYVIGCESRGLLKAGPENCKGTQPSPWLHDFVGLELKADQSGSLGCRRNVPRSSLSAADSAGSMQRKRSPARRSI